MKLTAGKLFALGNFILTTLAGSTAITALAEAGLSDHTSKLIIATLSLTGILWNGIGLILLNPEQQLQAVITSKNEPAVQKALVTTVSNYPGVDPIQTNENASPTLIAVAADRAVPRVLPPHA